MVLLENKTQEASAMLLEGKTQDNGADKVPQTFRRIANPVPIPGEKKKNNLGFEYGEHSYLGDAITLTLPGEKRVIAKEYPLTLENKLSLTYGQINGLAGDFYGTYDPISNGSSKEEQVIRFTDAYYTLAGPGARQDETRDILSVLQSEADSIKAAIERNEDPSEAYSRLPNNDVTFQKLTVGRPKGVPSYLALALINVDHFGQDARLAYDAGHSKALQVALDGDLKKAYAMNAFADHFLEDSFSVGHLRTPRRDLHGYNVSLDYLAKCMHDEDNAIGLTVQNPNGETWKCFGDKRALDHAGSENKKRCLEALQTSATEIYEAWNSKKGPSRHEAWQHAPTIDSAQGDQNLAAFFIGNLRRIDVTNRRNAAYTKVWWAATTATTCLTSGW